MRRFPATLAVREAGRSHGSSRHVIWGFILECFGTHAIEDSQTS